MTHYEPILPPLLLLPMLGVCLVFFCVRAVMRMRDPLGTVLSCLRVLAVVLLAGIIGMRPMREKSGMEVETKNLDVLFVVDDTISMYAMDYDGKKTRMSGVRSDCRFIMEQLQGANFGLIRYDNTARILAPFTQDRDNVQDALDTISIPDSYYAKGSALQTPYAAMEELLISSSKKEGRQTIVFFFSDGEETDENAVFNFKELAQYIENGAVLGYGTEAGGKMKNEYGSYIYDYESYDDAVSHIDEANLRLLADDLEISYIRMDRTGNVRYLTDAIRTGASPSHDSKRTVVYEDLYYYYALPLGLLLIAEAILTARRTGKM